MSQLLYKPDWEETKQHFITWWAGERFERCAMAVTAPKANRNLIHPPQPPSDPFLRWTDLDYISALNHYEHLTTYYGGEAFPIWNGGSPGHTGLPAYLGCPVELDMETVWRKPLLEGDDWDVTTLHLDPENYWWKFALKLVDRSVEESAGKSVPDIVGAISVCGDVLAALRGTERLLLDVAYIPERVQQAEFYLLEIWVKVYDILYSLVHKAAEGSTSWFRLWSPGRFYPTSCDFSYMISPKMFRSLFLPVIERWSNNLDHSVYHVDGVEAFKHVPALAELPGIQAFQILPGAGKPSPLHYLDTLRLVQARGKNLHISIGPEEVEPALELLSSRGLFIDTRCASEEQARYLLKKAEKWSHD
jgi:5-methyltetrahydrofolate--homocysteine methyltransferase